jgi:hypothetical protein
MKQIWKFKLAHGMIEVPRGAQYLTCQMQHGEICAWFIVDPAERDLEVRRYQIIGTGHDFNPQGLEHFATVQDGAYVWHLFQEVG